MSYFHPDTRQLECLQRWKIGTVHDLFRVVRRYVELNENVFPATGLYKRHILRFLNRQCDRCFLDFERMRDDAVIITGGVYPNQWFSLTEARPRSKEAPPRAPPPIRPLPPAVVDYNRDLSEEEALALAIRESLAVADAARVTSDDVSCPITLEVFETPVKLCHGHTFEKTAIEAWLAKSQTHPLTGEPLKHVVLTPDEGMRARVAVFLSN